ncbi:MAG: hypothetical protein JJ964_12625 [Rhizobiales bacterium]|nr:hypothetical protein [Hyphomicrobiales bacterium]
MPTKHPRQGNRGFSGASGCPPATAVLVALQVAHQQPRILVELQVGAF